MTVTSRRLTQWVLTLAATSSTHAAVLGSMRQLIDTQVGVVEIPDLAFPGITSRDAYASHIFKRQRDVDENGALLCRNGPCADNSCCGPEKKCGYGPDFCGEGCTSYCDAIAMCGKYADPRTDGKCGMNLCCSSGGWCGTTEAHCIGPNKLSPCQPEYGSCEMIRPSTCGEGSGTANGRQIGYYLAANVRSRVCNKITPSQITTAGYTHLFFAFASIDPTTFNIKPSTDEDVPLMKEFTALAKNGLQTWIAVGGYDFSDNETATHTTWSDMVSTPANRKSFIESTRTFMKEYGFTGIDIDWEYPASPERGGRLEDVANFASLVRDMREAYGTEFGISLTLAPDYWYLRYFDAKAMEPYVDWFGFMAYDLHGSWDSDVKTLGSIVRGQADIREINNNTLPLFYAGLDPSKISFGLAWYGRGYTLTDPSCNKLGCPFSGPSKPATCTNSEGVMSLVEIEALIKDKGLTPRLNQDSMMKELVWDDQWIGYDDDETHKMKRGFANNLCFGGTMAWSVDFYSGVGSGSEPPISSNGQCGKKNGGAVCKGSGFGKCCSSDGWCGSTDTHCGSGCQNGDCLTGGETTDGTCGRQNGNMFCGTWSQGSCCSSAGYCGDSEVHCGDGCQSGACDKAPEGGSGILYLDPDIYTDPNPTLQCYPPCEFILPPRTLDHLTTITPEPFSTSLERGKMETTVITEGGVEITTSVFETVIITTLITVPPITTSIIKYWDLNVTTHDGTITLWPETSILPPKFVLTLPETEGLPKATRTITPRPWPWPTKEPDPEEHNRHDTDIHYPHVNGKPTHICKSGCGHHCKIFCSHPCLLLCGGPDFPSLTDWWDPDDPNFPGVNPVDPGPGDPDDPDNEDDDEPDKDYPGLAYKAEFEDWDQGDTSEDTEAEELKEIYDELKAAGLLDFLDDGTPGGPGGTTTAPPKSTNIPPSATCLSFETETACNAPPGGQGQITCVLTSSCVSVAPGGTTTTPPKITTIPPGSTCVSYTTDEGCSAPPGGQGEIICSSSSSCVSVGPMPTCTPTTETSCTVPPGGQGGVTCVVKHSCVPTAAPQTSAPCLSFQTETACNPPPGGQGEITCMLTSSCVKFGPTRRALAREYPTITGIESVPTSVS